MKRGEQVLWTSEGAPDSAPEMRHQEPPGTRGRPVVPPRNPPPTILGTAGALESPSSIPAAKRKRAKAAPPAIKLKNKAEVIRYSKILIVALEEVLDYDPTRHHNEPPPALRIDDPGYLKEIRNLVGELRTLNSLLAQQHRSKQTAGAVNRLGRHFDTFLDRYAKSLGKGAGCLTIGVVASLLYQAGVGQDVIASILSHAKLPH
jgi:hypothetical protein